MSRRILRGIPPPYEGNERGESPREQEGGRPVEEVDERAEADEGAGDADGGGTVDQAVGEGALP